MNLPEKNDICYCGSGLRFKSCCIGKKVRTYGTNAKFRHDDIIKHNRTEPDGSITFHSEERQIYPIGVELMYGFFREKKNPKVLASFPVDPMNVRCLENFHFQEYGRILAVDTNTVEISGKIISVGTVVNGEFKIKEDGKPTIDFKPEFTIELWNPMKHAEVLTWEFVVTNLERYPNRPKIAVVVDSHQTNLLRLNLRDIPLFGAYYLPDNIRLLFATSDGGMEFLGNQMIRACDRMSSKIIDRIKASPFDFENVYMFKDNRYEAFRYWKIDPNTKPDNLKFEHIPPPPQVKCEKYVERAKEQPTN